MMLGFAGVTVAGVEQQATRTKQISQIDSVDLLKKESADDARLA